MHLDAQRATRYDGTMDPSEYSIGDILEAYCSRCRLNLDVSIAALMEGVVQKVMCRTCGNEVKYRPPVDMEARQQQKLSRLVRQHGKRRNEQEQPAAETVGADSPRAALRQLWDELTDNVDGRCARVYDPTREYEIEEAVLHKRFGMGIVHQISEDGSMSVLFRNGFQELAKSVEPNGG
jgi:hypothetical protein